MSAETRIEENHVLSSPFALNSTKNNKNTSSPQSKVSFWAHTSSVKAYCDQYDKTVIDGPLSNWWFRPLYTDAPTTFSGPTPPRKKRHHEDLKEFSPPSIRPSLPKKGDLAKT
jgi:hypothetical protein